MKCLSVNPNPRSVLGTNTVRGPFQDDSRPRLSACKEIIENDIN